MVVTRGSQAIDGTDSQVVIAGAPTWGFTRVVVNEHRGFDTLLVDLDPEGSAGDAAELIAEFESGAPDREVAFRAGARFTPASRSWRGRPPRRIPASGTAWRSLCPAFSIG
jgi:hypothetical protein